MDNQQDGLHLFDSCFERIAMIEEIIVTIMVTFDKIADGPG